MLKRTTLLVFVGVLLAAALGYGVARLFILRYEDGDVYPPYSTLRADPLGTKGAYEALEQLSGVFVRRNFQPLPKLQPAAPVTLIFAGIGRFTMWEPREVSAFDQLLLSGSRAVFTFLPMERSLLAEEMRREEDAAREAKKAKRAAGKAKGEKNKKREEEDEAKKSPLGGGDDEQSSLVDFSEVARRWGVAFAFLAASETRQFDRKARLEAVERVLEPEISWHSALYFKELKPDWRVLYTCDGKPVVIERVFGGGSLVLAADSYFLSNEALRAERHPQLLAALFSGPPDFVFDEEHHGLRDDPGIASLARKYRLHGVVAGLVLLAGLFVWKNAVRFLPPHAGDSGGEDVVAGKDASEGFIHLLRRTIPPAQILEVCAAEWRKAFAHRPRALAVIEERCAAERAQPARRRQPVEAYRDISRRLPRR